MALHWLASSVAIASMLTPWENLISKLSISQGHRKLEPKLAHLPGSVRADEVFLTS